MQFYQTVLNAHSQGSFRLNARLQDAIDSTLEIAINDFSLASIDETLISNIRSSKLIRKTSNFTFICEIDEKCDRVT